MKGKKIALLWLGSVVVILTGAWFALSPMIPVTTDSPKKQGTLELLVLTKGDRAQVGNVPIGFATIGASPPVLNVAWRWSEPISTQKGPNRLSACLVGKKGREWPIELDFDLYSFDSTVKAGVYGGYGPDFANPDLVVRAGNEEVGRWRLRGFPEPKYQFGPNDRDVTKAKIIGFDVTYAPTIEDGNDRGLYNAGIVLDGPMNKEDQYLVSEEKGRSDWKAGTKGCWMGQFVKPGSKWLGGTVLGSGLDITRQEITLKIERFRTYDEKVELKGLRLEPDDTPSTSWDGKPIDGFKVVFPKGDIVLTTPSGLHLTFSQGEHLPKANDHDRYGGCMLRLEPGDAKVWLPASPLCKQTGKPVSLELTIDGHYRGMDAGTGYTEGKEVRRFFVPSIPIPKEYIRTGPIPPVTIIIRQKAIIEEGQAKMLAHVKKVSRSKV